jgi:UDP-N-acetylmuramoyl-L-alanyl-D-glutamate--2,6-diaminopimelate ligase
MIPLTQYDIKRLLALEADVPIMEISSVTEDSRQVRPGTLFVASVGEKTDGHLYAAAARDAGAVAVLGNRADFTDAGGIPYLYYDRPHRAAALLAQALAGNPTRELCVIGITGTNGKTSTACLTQHLLNCTGNKAANLGTLGYDLAEKRIHAAHTTPFGETLAGLFAEARKAELTHVVMEVSSHALAQERVAGVDFNVAAFTNLTRDHLDYHETMDSYLQAKIKLFEMVRDADASDVPRFGVVNKEDSCARPFKKIMPDRTFTYGTGGDVRAEGIHICADGASFRLVSPWGNRDVHIHLVGKHNVLNALCAFTIGAGLNLPMDAVIEGIAALPAVPGRFEAVHAGQDFSVIVDYAHTDDGLRNALMAARAVCTGRIILVFGCGGDRDKGKRPKMGAVAAELADFVVATSDNPRTEDPARILLDIEVGLQHKGKHKQDDYVVIESRREAIFYAIALAHPNDLVLIAGKGHENYQIIGTERRHFDDREQSLEALRERNR